MSEWIIPFEARGPVGMFHQNFLWRDGSTYIMDNHRAAAWCWLREICRSGAYKLFHIDAHYDCACERFFQEVGQVIASDMGSLSIEDYLALKCPWGKKTRLAIAHDNYLSLFLALYGRLVKQCMLATHHEGESPFCNQIVVRAGTHLEPVDPWRLLRRVNAILEPGLPWIVNLDLDYFFCLHHGEDDPGMMFAEAYVTSLFRTIADALDAGRICVLTVCLSPDFCGGWPAAEGLCAKLCETLHIDFVLPGENSSI